MRHYVHQLVASCVCLPFGAEQVVHSWFLELYFAEYRCLKQLSIESEPEQCRCVLDS